MMNRLTSKLEGNKSHRNAYMLRGKSARNGYDWWWHSLVAINENSGEKEPFFIEYYVINPSVSPDQPTFGQIPGKKQKPSYAMIKAGKWGNEKAQIHNFWPSRDFIASYKKMEVKIGDNYADEHTLRGFVQLDPEKARNNTHFMSDAGFMSWDLKIHKEISYQVGYGASTIFRRLNLFEMFWHVQGMKTRYDGVIEYNGTKYLVKPEFSGGYQDKNWGKDYTSPWIWLNCNFFANKDGKVVPDASLDIGGGNPKVMGFSMGPKILVAFHLDKKLYEFNFTKFLFQKQQWNCWEDDNHIYWDVEVSNRKHRLEVHFSCEKEKMLLINYENPLGEKNHNKLWNGGHAHGNLTLFEKKTNKIIADLTGSFGGCEYGVAD